MNIDLDTIGKAIMAAIGAFFIWFAKRLHKKIEGSVTREELKDYIDTVRIERKTMHEDNTKRIDGLTARIDILFELLTK